MADSGPRPKPRPRSLKPQQQAARDKLLASFNGFGASTVSAEHIETAKECIRDGGPPRDRYKFIDFVDILKRNELKPDHLTMMTSAYDLLLKYAINLLKARRPQVWRSIKTNNSAFKARVDCMEGARDILTAIGYSERTENAMQFPESVMQPDMQRLCAVAAELLMAKLEVEEKEEERGRSLQSSPRRQQRPSADPGEEAIPPNSFDHSQTTWLQINGSDGHQFDQRHHGYTQPMPPKPPSEGRLPPSRPPQRPPRQKTPSSSSESSSMDASSSQQQQQPSQQQPSQQQQPSLGSSSGGSTSDLTTASESSPLPSFGEAATATASSSTTAESRKSSSRFKKEFEQLREIRKERQAVNQKYQGLTVQVPVSQPAEHGMLRKFATSTINVRIPPDDKTNQPHSDDGGILRAMIPIPQSSGAAKDTERSPTTARKLENPSQQAIKYPPGRKQHPQYRDDAIPEEDERKLSQHLSGLSDSMGSGPFCEKCKCKLSAASTICLYCNTPVHASGAVASSQPDSAPEIPPRAKSKLAADTTANPVDSQATTVSVGAPIIRATPQAAEEATKQYRLSRLQETIALTPLSQQQGTSPTQQQPPPTSVNAAATPSSQPQLQPLPPNSTIAAAPSRNLADTSGQSEAAAIGTAEPDRSSAAGGASGSSERKTVTGQSWTEMQREKEEAWKRKQLSDGVKPEDVRLLSGEPAHEREGRQRLQQPQEPPRPRRGKIMDPKKYKSECLVGDPEQFANEEKEKQRMQQMETDGATLLFWVKNCSNYNYSLDEVQIAFDQYRAENQTDPLAYLQTSWERKIQNVRLWVSAPPPSVGYPSEVEARRFLIEAKGDVQKAVDDCYQYRVQKIEELRQKMLLGGKDLPWEGAMHALTASNMDVDEACWTVQCGELQPLYDYIFSEWNKVTQTDMEDIKKLIKRDDLDREIRYRMLLGEYKLENQDRAELVIQLLNEVEVDANTQYPLYYYIGAAKDFQTLEGARHFLLRNCTICMENIPTHDMVTMLGCTDEICKECFKAYFSLTIKEKTVKHFNCPVCGEPDLANRDMSQGLYLELFVHMIKQHLDKECYDLCQQKLTDFNLSKDANFCWCANEVCRSGFINDRDPNIKKLQCHACSKFMCFQCKKPWEEQHQGLSCDQFAQWKQDNDPEAQEQGLAAHLRANGIDCPDCHMRYDLARGGCMHFKCTQCPNEFCSGCGQSFRKGQQCGKLQSCGAKGLHAHHPRDCLFYLRDFDVAELQAFLQENNIKFDTDPPQAQVEAARQKAAQQVGGEVEAEAEVAEAAEPAVKEEGEQQAAAAAAPAVAKVELKCRVPLQKDLQDGLVDEECGREVLDGHAGICVVHYKEYLVNKINQAKLDPVTMYETDKVKVILLREEKEVPEKDDDESDDDFRDKLIQHVKDQLPLTRGKANRVDAKAEAA